MTANQLKAHLLLARNQGMTDWAVSRGYRPRTVMQVVARWVTDNKARRDPLPKGRVSHAILRDLSREIGQEIVPGILKEAA